MLVKCSKCQYRWNYRGRSQYATCPKCLSKVKISKQETITIQCLICNSKLETENDLRKIYQAGWAECIVITANTEVQSFICPQCLSKYVFSD